MSHISLAEETGDYGTIEGIRRYHRAKDHGEWQLLMTWLAYHPDSAAEFAKGIRAEVDIEEHLGSRRVTPPRQAPVRTGSMVGKFEIHEEIGLGGMGVVYRAFDTNLKRDRALKMVRPDIPLSATELAKFREEAEIIATFDHPNIVRVLSCDETPSGEPYLVMPLMSGSLAAWLTKLKQRGENLRRPEKEAAELVRDVALGVHHAHQRGLIHRDLKPGNILLDEKCQPHVADFGLARRVDVSASITGQLVGTPAYMAPEQARAEKGLTTAVDVHALGVILFEMLTGGLPYSGSDKMSIMLRIADETETPPPVSRFRPDVSADLETICTKCLEKRPEDRYLSAQAVADALDRFLNDEPQIDAPRRGLITRTKRVIDRRIDTPSMASWPAAFWGMIGLTVSQFTIQAAVLTESPAWIAHLGWTVYFGGWLIVAWLTGIARFGALNRIEHVYLAQHIGMLIAGLALIPVGFETHGGYGLALYPPLMVVIGLGTFFQGAYHWGRYYLIGLGVIIIAASLPLIPVRFWPIVFFVPQISLLLWGGFRMRAFDREARASGDSLV